MHFGGVRKEQLYKRVGQSVAAARGKKLTQQELARSVGMSRPAIANIERGEQQIYLHQIVSIAAALDVQVAELLPKGVYKPVASADVSVSGDKLNRAQERAVRELVGSITAASRR